MGFVKTPQEIAEIEGLLSVPRFVSGERLTVELLTTEDVVERLLPPPLEPAARPVLHVSVGRWQSNFLGDFAGGVVSLAARHGDVDGGYPLAMYMDSEPPIAFGRDFFGEPKKLARAGLFRNGELMRGWVERHGVRLIDIEARLGEDRGPARVERFSFNFKARPSATGVGLEEPAILTRTAFDTELRVQRVGEGSIDLRGTVHDPLDELEILSIRRVLYTEDDVTASARPVATVSEEEFLPYHYGRMDDWRAMDTAPAPLPA
jgi:acetoacetate decarboxylase